MPSLPPTMWPFYGALAIWGAAELALLVFRRSSNFGRGGDAGTLSVITVTIALSVPASVWLSVHGVGRVDAIAKACLSIGPVLILLGIAVRWWAILTLRRFFTVDVTIQKDHQVVTNGPYRLVRHPAYTGALLSCAGVGVTLASWAVLACLMIPLILALLRRIAVEEKALHAALGDAYAEFCRGRARLIPGLY